ncbi:large ribosomal subunit protein mL64-like [Eurosta solidaginis]|uniref:large ribosomal subunit protein mL64-like n=1 Tax=Eurosta solidaginis TaxID=178769 RepID=UPI003531318D
MWLTNIYKMNVLVKNGKNSVQTHALNYKSTTTLLRKEDSTNMERARHTHHRDMSKLLQQNRNVLLEIWPYNDPCSWIHLTEKYKRKVFGRYGLLTGICPNICFNMRRKDTVSSAKEPCSFYKLIINAKTIESYRSELIERRETEIATKLIKLEQWKVEMQNRILKKEAEVLAIKQEKQRLIEEVRRHFGFKVDPKDDRFKEMLEQKEREEKKKQKEAKRRARQDKMLTKLAEKTSAL